MKANVGGLFFLAMAICVGAVAQGPLPVSPGASTDISVASGRCPTFLWTPAAAGEAIELVVYRIPSEQAEAPPERVLAVSLPETASGWTPPLGRCLEPGESYAWSVRAGGEWSEANLFEVATLPSPTEVREALEVLRQFLAGAEPSATSRDVPALGDPASPTQGGGPSEAVDVPGRKSEARAPSPDEELGLSGGASPELGTPAPSPSPSLVFDDQIHLGTASHVFRDDDVFLWTDGSRFSAIGSLGLGHRALEQSTANNNTAVGHTALRLNYTGANNSAFGEDALYSNSIGENNSAFGEDALLLNQTGSNNSAFGEDSLRTQTDASNNSAFGQGALQANTTGESNSAFGTKALYSSTTRSGNSAFGAQALEHNTTGSENSAFGYRALWLTETNVENSAFGFEALSRNKGSFNSAFGDSALRMNSDGDRNSAFGTGTLDSNTIGSDNTAFGQGALGQNTEGSHNVALGESAHRSNKTGSWNTALGENTLRSEYGSYNIAVGYRAGYSFGPNSGYNIVIGNRGVGTDDNTIRIGDSEDHDRAFIAGIRDKTTGVADAIAVLIDSDGQLGTTSSRRSIKQEVREIGEMSRRLLELRPVSFRYRQHAAFDPHAPLQFGLIAEEVAEVFPELVVYDADDRPSTVKYHLISSLLLNELQEQHRRVELLSWMVGTMLLVGVAATVGRWRSG